MTAGIVRARHVELLDAPQRVRLPAGSGRRRCAAHIGDQQHVRTVAVELEPVGDVLAQHRRRERPERFAELDLQVHHRLHLRRPRVAEDRPSPERARPELHAALQQPDDLLLREMRGDDVGQLSRDPLASPCSHCASRSALISLSENRGPRYDAAHPVGIPRNARDTSRHLPTRRTSVHL